jgi:hypothetical protein
MKIGLMLVCIIIKTTKKETNSMANRKSLLSAEQEKLLAKFQKNVNDKATPLNNNSDQKANSNSLKPQIRRSGSRGK